MAFLDKNGLQTLTNKLVQGDAIKVASHRGHTVKNVIDNITRECENVATPNTMNLENRINEFKVGKGRDIDVSGDVEEGKIEVEIKGRTFQNLLTNMQPKRGLSYRNGIYTFEASKNAHVGFNTNNMLKNNTTYSIIIEFLELPKNIANIPLFGDREYGTTKYIYNPIVNKKYVVSATTRNTPVVDAIYLSVRPDTIRENIRFKAMLLEGDYTQTPTEELPKYFEGIKSSFEDGIVDVEVQGKNLISKATEWRLGVINADTGIYSDKPSGTRYTSNLIYNPSGKELYIRSKGHMWNYLYFYDENKNYLGFCTNQGMGSNYNFNINFDNSKRIAKYFIISFGNQDALEIGEVYEYQETDYITPYKKKISFNIEEPLRSLPNGVCDEIRNNNGQWELVRRVGKTILDGSETYTSSSPSENTMFFILRNILCQKNGYCISNNFYYEIGSKDNEHIRINADGYIVFWLNISKLPSQDVEGLKQWLSQNPTTVYYELAEPIITPIEPIEFDVKPLATMTINSDIAPISNHKVILNRAGQIEQGIVQIAELKKRVDSLETAYDSYLLETQHKLSILGFEYELESEEI